MSSYTKQAIKQAFLELLEERPLSAITVKDVVERCGINRNSFYYHFQDLPSLLEEIVREESDAIIGKYSSLATVADCMDEVVRFSCLHRRSVMHIYRSVNREVFEQYLMKICRYFVQNYVVTLLADLHLPKSEQTVICDYYQCVCFGLLMDWLESGMKEEKAIAIRKILCLKMEMLPEFATKLKEKM